MYALDKTKRLHNKKDYDHIFAQAVKTVTTEFILLHRENSLGYTRLGLALSKKMVAKAVQRNRLKRLLRESFRTHNLPAIDVVILARSGAATVDNNLIYTNLGAAWEKINIFYAS